MTGGLHVRPSDDSDSDAIWSILKPIVEKGEEFCAPRDGGRVGAFAYFCPPTAEVFVAETEGEVVGAYYLKPNQTGGGAHVCNAGYAVHPEATGKGVARTMLAHSLERARARGFRAMQYNFVVATNARAIATWERAGFKTVGRLPGAFEHPHHGFVDALVMYRDL